jgi:hypothetical protein
MELTVNQTHRYNNYETFYPYIKHSKVLSVPKANLKSIGMPKQGATAKVDFVKWSQNNSSSFFFQCCCCCYRSERYVRKKYGNEFDERALRNQVGKINLYYADDFDGQNIAFYIGENTILMRRFEGEHIKGNLKPGWIMLDGRKKDNYRDGNPIDFDYVYRLSDTLDKLGKQQLDMMGGEGGPAVVYQQMVKEYPYNNVSDVIKFLSQWEKYPYDISKLYSLSPDNIILSPTNTHEYDLTDSDESEEMLSTILLV